jgi:hypothetical protein
LRALFLRVEPAQALEQLREAAALAEEARFFVFESIRRLRQGEDALRFG